MIYKTTYISKLGKITLASDGISLIGLWFEGQKYYFGKYQEEILEENNLKVFAEVREWLNNYFAGKNPDISSLKLAPRGTDFQQKVWNKLLTIPYGKVTTYGEIAKALNVNSGQAIGGAIGHNPISIIIPCHRIISKNGSLTGYAGGIDKKIKLLELEQVDMVDMYIPNHGTAL